MSPSENGDVPHSAVEVGITSVLWIYLPMLAVVLLRAINDHRPVLVAASQSKEAAAAQSR